jgi:formylglycine-generating enzyme required for sulfatase activity
MILLGCGHPAWASWQDAVKNLFGTSGPAAPAPVHPPADTVLVPVDLVWVPGGVFSMGSDFGADEERPSHLVFIDGFFIGKDEVTNAQYAKFLNEYGQDKVVIDNLAYKLADEYEQGLKKVGDRWAAQTGYENYPVVCVTWFGANTFCQFYQYSLPTEAQWEYAARGGSDQNFFFGKSEYQLGNYAWYNKNSDYKTHRVGQKKPNKYGLYDIYGNVWEWCADWYEEHYYHSGPSHNPLGPATGIYRVLRGGSWSSAAFVARSATRSQDYPNSLGNSSGFRVVRNRK